MNRLLKFLFHILLLTATAGCAGSGAVPAAPPAQETTTPAEKTPLVVFAAGSLIRPFDDLEKAFEAQNPQIDVLGEYHGSIQVIRHAAELHEPIDVVASADHALIPMLMYTTTDSQSGKANASWYLRFATNRMGLAYTGKSRRAAEITPQNWCEVLSDPEVRFGLADPRFDAAGYRALMILQLAQSVCGRPDLFDRMLAGAFQSPVLAVDEEGAAVVRVPEILETRKDSRVVLRGGSIQLLALLESGDVDYAFEYESVIRQHNLELIQLPPELNLGDPAFAESYGKVKVKLDFQRFASVKPEFKGEQIGYGITIPVTSPQPAAAAQYIAFLLGPEGRAVMAAAAHPLLEPVTADGYANLPEALKPLCEPAP